MSTCFTLTSSVCVMTCLSSTFFVFSARPMSSASFRWTACFRAFSSATCASLLVRPFSFLGSGLPVGDSGLPLLVSAK